MPASGVVVECDSTFPMKNTSKDCRKSGVRKAAVRQCAEKEKRIEELNAQLEQSLAHKRFRYDALSFMLSHPSVDELMAFIAERMLVLFECDRVSIGGNDGECRSWTRPGADIPDCQCFAKCPLCPLNPQIACEPHVVCIPDVRRAEGRTFPNECLAKSVMSLLVRDGTRPWRRLTVHYMRSRHEASEYERHTLESAVNIISTALERERLVAAQDAEAALRVRALDKAPIAVYIKDADDDFRYVFVNDFTLTQIGLRREEMLGRTDFDIMPRHMAEAYRRNDEAAMKSDESSSVQESYVDAWGRTRRVQSVRCSAVGADGHRLVIGYSLELTELLEKQARIEALQKAAERERDHAIVAEKAKADFFASVSHDIRTPLNSIIGFSELLRNETDADVRREYLDSIAFSGNTLLELVNDVLDIARLDSGHLSLACEQIDLGRQIKLLLRTFESSAREKRLALRADIGDLPVLGLDKHRVRQVLFNLVGNAVKYTDAGGVAVSASFERTSARLGILRLVVRDTGIGIAAEDISRLMQPYVRLQGMNARGGTGLGLAICKRIVESMGGNIAIDSEPGIGSAFTVVLPSVPYIEGTLAERAEAAPEDMSARMRDLSALRVLVVDDLEMNRRVLLAGCRRLGAGHTAAASSSEEALSLLRRETFDLVLTDMKMPGMDGGEFIGTVRDELGLKTLPVFLVTADIEARNYYRRLGADGVLLKPVVLSRLAETLSSACIGEPADNANGGAADDMQS